MRGVPKTMQEGDIVYDDIIQDTAEFFTKQIALLKKFGVAKEKIILDPGFGFGKTVEHNLEILRRFGEFKTFDMPLMIGVSRKSTIEKILEESFKSIRNGLKSFPTSERLAGSLAATAVAVLNGANIVRTHDVGETKKFLAVLDRIKANVIPTEVEGSLYNKT
jgi:dihydropteroate synthase